jgi:hypothetical protein
VVLEAFHTHSPVGSSWQCWRNVRQWHPGMEEGYSACPRSHWGYKLVWRSGIRTQVFWSLTWLSDAMGGGSTFMHPFLETRWVMTSFRPGKSPRRLGFFFPKACVYLMSLAGPRKAEAHLEPQGFFATDPAFVSCSWQWTPFRDCICFPSICVTMVYKIT